MGKPIDPQALRSLEAQAEECEQIDDFLGALDIYEEIVSRGWADARHLCALGHCYLKNRQGKNAKETWLRAHALDPQDQSTLEALDRFFPGWEKQASSVSTARPAASVAPPAGSPPPPPPPSFGGSPEMTVTMEVTSKRSQAQPFAPSTPPSQTAPAVAPVAASMAGMAPTPRPAAPAPAVSAVNPATGEVRVNWEYVLADAAEEAAYHK